MDFEFWSFEFILNLGFRYSEFQRKALASSLIKGLYTPKGFFDHAASLHQTFVHCGIFLTAASRRSLGSVSVPVRRVALSRPLLVVALVVSYTTNKLISHRPLPKRLALRRPLRPDVSVGEHIRNYLTFRRVMPNFGVGYQCVTHPFAMVAPRYARLRNFELLILNFDSILNF